MKIAASIDANTLLGKKGILVERLISNKKYKNNTFRNIFTALQKAGIHGIELYIPNNFSKKDLSTIIKILGGYQVKVLSLHQPIRLLSHSSLGEIRNVFAIADTLGAKRIVLHTDMNAKNLRDPKKIIEIKSLEKQYGILACFENMQFHHIFWRNKLLWHEETFQRFMQKNNLHITLDTSHLAQTKKDIITFFKNNKNLIQNIHISDFKPHPFSASLLGTYLFHLPIGEGNLPIQKFLSVLQKEHYKGNVTTEINSSLDQLCESIRIIKQYSN